MLQLGTKRGAAQERISGLTRERPRSPIDSWLLSQPALVKAPCWGRWRVGERRVSDSSLPSRTEALFFSRPCVASHHTASYSTGSSHVGWSRGTRAAGPVQTQAPLPPLVHLSRSESRVSASGPLSSVLGWLAGIQWVGGIWPLERLNLASDLSPSAPSEGSDSLG